MGYCPTVGNCPCEESFWWEFVRVGNYPGGSDPVGWGIVKCKNGGGGGGVVLIRFKSSCTCQPWSKFHGVPSVSTIFYPKLRSFLWQKKNAKIFWPEMAFLVKTNPFHWFRQLCTWHSIELRARFTIKRILCEFWHLRANYRTLVVVDISFLTTPVVIAMHQACQGKRRKG